VTDQKHPLVSGVNTRFDVPHSRFNEVHRDQFAAANLKILVESEESGVHLAVSEDGFRIVFFQGHPEYDSISLLKEYKRDIGRYIHAETDNYPPIPENYFSLQSRAILEEFSEKIIDARAKNQNPPDFPEDLIAPLVDNTWHDSAEAVINNWIGKVYQLTDIERCKPFNATVDPSDPLGLNA